MLCFTLQRYKIESNSQRVSLIYIGLSRCVSHCKDTKLKAIHNCCSLWPLFYLVVFHTAKIQNWKQFTTVFSEPPQLSSCVSHCKDTKLKAIHNFVPHVFNIFFVVFHTAKIQNWKQFTTKRCLNWKSHRLCFTLQRYKIESNSQLLRYKDNVIASCVSHCKDTKLKAIHNYREVCPIQADVVFHTAKIQNWKQFTTVVAALYADNMLCFTLQRYKIESNSQQDSFFSENRRGCVSHCKDTKLKAIHNTFALRQITALVVFHTAKIQNWKQFTTHGSKGRTCQPLCFTLQRYKIESNSQRKPSVKRQANGCVSHCKDTKLKAIHNYWTYRVAKAEVVFHTAKIQNWKQFTTYVHDLRIGTMLCFTLQRYKIESNSQHILIFYFFIFCCVSHCKDTKLKAIHNKFISILLPKDVVFHTAKIQNWKQFTTLPYCFL